MIRLLTKTATGGIVFEEFSDHNVPPYAILSHTWGEERGEVTFKDMDEGVGHHKAGYQKIEFMAWQAAAHGLDYFWIDTCCIDKKSSAELSEAIISMYEWYKKAARC